ncbi:unnamed protein product [Paramecium primaurelia]|uniref:Protein kinase domain-containing protein n=1 Tax=Paramecium primaurelia TaxID=5886 RepID=A0A8S1NEJ8_PARPR|nr:unnamed protein product [Paramecium primaurelia]
MEIEQVTFSCEVIRKHLIVNKHYYLQLLYNKILIRENLEHPAKYEIELNLKGQISWKIGDDHKIKEFGIKYNNKLKWFTGISEQLHQLKQHISNKIFMTGISNFYSSHEQVGTGASCKVILIKDYNTHICYAAKCVSKEYIRKKKTSDRFDRLVNEIEILRTLNAHPNLIKLQELYEGENSYYLIFEYLEGETLHKYIKNSGHLMTETTVRSILQQLLLGIKMCHQQNIIHRDMKLENVVLTKLNKTENIKIIDFGLAIFNNSKQPFSICGTPGYIAPEILNYEDNKYKSEKFVYTPQIDMFGIGAMLYRIMTREPLFNADKTKELLHKNQKCLFVKRTISQYSNILNQILFGLLEFNPKKRFSADQALELLQSQQINQIILKHESNRNINLTQEFQIPIFTDVIQIPYLFPNRKIKKELGFVHSYHINEDRICGFGKSYLPSFSIRQSLDVDHDSLIEETERDQVLEL